MNTTEKSCYTCKYFVNYYVKNAERLYKTYAGVCQNDNIKNRKHAVKYDCPYWEINESEVKERRVDIERAICKMQKSLEDILIILKSDNSPD